MLAAIVLAITLLGACSPSLRSAAAESDVVLDVEPSAVTPGDSIRLLLRNETAGPIGYNLCTSSLQRRDGDAWRPVPSDRVCTMELRTLAPAEQTGYSLELPGELLPGEYRYTTTVERLDPGIRMGVQSDSFRIPS